MEPDGGKASSPGLGAREQRFLSRLAQKYERDEKAGLLRGYLIAAGAILALFALARWVPWWWAALLAVEAAGLALFHQYKRFARFKNRLLLQLWRERAAA